MLRCHRRTVGTRQVRHVFSAQTMTNHWIDSGAPPTLAALIERVAASLLVSHSAAVALEMDIDPEAGVPADPALTSLLVESLIRAAVAEMPGGGDLTITAVTNDRGYELEIADTGESCRHRVCSRPLVAAKIGARVQWDDCPQGGSAVTVFFPPRQNAIRRAA